jgi:hypothetical protein
VAAVGEIDNNLSIRNGTQASPFSSVKGWLDVNHLVFLNKLVPMTIFIKENAL